MKFVAKGRLLKRWPAGSDVADRELMNVMTVRPSTLWLDLPREALRAWNRDELRSNVPFYASAREVRS